MKLYLRWWQVALSLTVAQIGWAGLATDATPPISKSNAPEIPSDKGYLVREIRDGLYWLTDGAYPGFMPYKNLGIAEDVQGYIQAHADALTCDFDVFVGGHVSRLGTRKDVESAAKFVNELRRTTASVLALDFPTYIKTHPANDKWNLHNEFETELTEKCYAELLPKWTLQLADSETYLRDNCWAMIEAQIVQLAPQDRLGNR